MIFNDSENRNCFSPFFPANIEYGSVKYGSVVQACIAKKFINVAEKMPDILTKNYTAIELASVYANKKRLRLAPGWHEKEYEVLKGAYKSLFDTYPNFRQQLLDTQDDFYYDNNTVAGWGMSGANMVGRVLTELKRYYKPSEIVVDVADEQYSMEAAILSSIEQLSIDEAKKKQMERVEEEKEQKDIQSALMESMDTIGTISIKKKYDAIESLFVDYNPDTNLSGESSLPTDMSINDIKKE